MKKSEENTSEELRAQAEATALESTGQEETKVEGVNEEETQIVEQTSLLDLERGSAQETQVEELPDLEQGLAQEVVTAEDFDAALDVEEQFVIQDIEPDNPPVQETQLEATTIERGGVEETKEEEVGSAEISLGAPSDEESEDDKKVAAVEDIEAQLEATDVVIDIPTEASPAVAAEAPAEEPLPNMVWQAVKAAFRFKSDESLAREILQAKYPNDAAKVEQRVARLGAKKDEIERVVREDIYGKRAFNIDLEIPDNINEVQLKAYFKKVLNQYSSFSSQSLHDEYQKKPKSWFESNTTRARMVLIEATDKNITDIGKAILDSSPLERVVAVGLDDEKQTELKFKLLGLWEAKITQVEASETLAEGEAKYGTRLLETLKELNQKPEATRLDDFDLNELVGPHGFTETKDISYKSLQQELETTFGSKLDEIVLFGTDNDMAQELPILSKLADAHQYLAIRSENFAGEEVSKFWTVALKDVADPISHITAAKGPDEMLADGKHEVNPSFEKFFEDKGKEHGLEPENTAYLKNMFVSHSLYLTNLSPKLYATTITKAQSGINGKGALAVGEALPWGAVGRIIATAKGSRFAVNATMVDTANDIHHEEQEKLEAYKDLFDNLLEHYEKDSETVEEAYEKAIDQVFIAYKNIESGKEINEALDNGETLRLQSFIHANRTNITNERGILLIQPQPLVFAFGLAGVGLGVNNAINTFGDNGNNETNNQLEENTPYDEFLKKWLVTSLGVYGVSLATTVTSLLSQKTANAYHLVRWHRISARSRAENQKAQDIRQKGVDGVLATIKESRSLEKFAKLPTAQKIPTKRAAKTTVRNRANKDKAPIKSIFGNF
ncbi:hypothetical protein [Ascidiimonas sp. W6]|uniref:hypothetical protein n=1 Tax=Ascidiimonas meishanensis TaxID=3128903 RepID=UPI0030ECD0FD